MSLPLITKGNPANFHDNWIYSQSARAASVLSTHFTSFEKQYQFFNGLDVLKGLLLVYTNHINNEKCMHHITKAYLYSTSLNKIKNFPFS